jgi:cell wall-associated NlpC family hydrolase
MMAKVSSGLPTYEFANDPLPPESNGGKGQADLSPRRFRPMMTARLGDVEFNVSERVDASSPWRKTGNTSFEHFLGAISRTHPPGGQSPLVQEARELHQILNDAGLSRFAAAMLWHEKKNDTWRDTPIPAWMHNPFSTRDRSRPGEWEQFPSYVDAARAWIERVSKDPYPQDASIQEFVGIYAPGFDDNDEARYVAVLTQEINELPLEGAVPAVPKGKPVSIPGLARQIFVPTDLVVEIQLVPPDHTNNRPGIAMTPQTYTQHDTGNPREGMGADAHSRWLDTFAPGAADDQVGVHLFVDDHKVIIKTPFNEVQWHAGDSDGPGNMSSISCELCVNADRDVARAERNAAIFAAAVIRDGLQKGIDALIPHQHWNQKDCPHSLLPRWNEFRDTVGRLVAEGGTPAATFPGLPATMPAEVLLALFPDANPNGPVTKTYIDYCVNHMPQGMWPRFNGFKDLSNGTRWWDFNPLQIFSDSKGKVWVAGDAPGPDGQPATPTVAAMPRMPGAIADMKPAATLPVRDFAQKDAAIERDSQRRRAVTTSNAKLRSSPHGDVVGTLAAGTEVTVLGGQEDGFLPVAIRDGHPGRGYIRADEISDQSGKPKREERPKGPRKDKQTGGTNGTNGSADPGVVDQGGDVGADGDVGARVAAEAQRYIGRPYVFATHGPDTFDCSGLVHWVVLQAAGSTISPDSHAQFNMGAPVDWDRLEPGDIVFYDTMNGTEVREGNAASHVGIFVRDGQMVNALNEERGVIASDPFSDYFKPRYIGARRLV